MYAKQQLLTEIECQASQISIAVDKYYGNGKFNRQNRTQKRYSEEITQHVCVSPKALCLFSCQMRSSKIPLLC